MMAKPSRPAFGRVRLKLRTAALIVSDRRSAGRDASCLLSLIQRHEAGMRAVAKAIRRCSAVLGASHG